MIVKLVNHYLPTGNITPRVYDKKSDLLAFPFCTAGRVRSLSTALWSLTHLTALHLSDNSLSRIPPDIAKLHNLVYLDLSSNKIRSLPAELGNMVSLRWVTLRFTSTLNEMDFV